MSKIVISLSGGLDSAVLLSKLTTEGHDVIPFHFQYGSKHNPYEKDSAHKIASQHGLQMFSADLSGVMAGSQSTLMAGGPDVPEGHYEAESMRQTVVPGRNLIFLAVLAGFAERVGAEHVAIGAHAGDHHIYPDCRPEFLDAAATAIHLSSGEKVSLLAPFKYIDKTTIVRVGQRYGTPFELSRTCYKDQSVACGKCGSCQERLTAFFKCNAEDPIEYESRVFKPR